MKYEKWFITHYILRQRERERMRRSMQCNAIQNASQMQLTMASVKNNCKSIGSKWNAEMMITMVCGEKELYRENDIEQPIQSRFFSLIIVTIKWRIRWMLAVCVTQSHTYWSVIDIIASLSLLHCRRKALSFEEEKNMWQEHATYQLKYYSVSRARQCITHNTVSDSLGGGLKFFWSPQIPPTVLRLIREWSQWTRFISYNREKYRFIQMGCLQCVSFATHWKHSKLTALCFDAFLQ